MTFKPPAGSWRPVKVKRRHTREHMSSYADVSVLQYTVFSLSVAVSQANTVKLKMI